ncbi:hypothetical protein [Thiocapsa marina]|uniref:Uncharacterized protein n=1 Tax=Thiocapsa marina 5811 TaxID=768671 RepID=F9U7Z5_9GAMM|nr:hypothetical protein [Thiocapsa marina]EGV19775.1 hypothetical protein ThimaDRAFT_1221 [Thiocapsa marina 5811]
MRKPIQSTLLLLLAMPLVPVAVADEGTAKILAPWEANGQLFQIAVDKLQFIGTFEGVMYIEHGDGLLDAALFTCPSTQIIHVLSNELDGQGYCTIESPTGDYVYAEFTCDGEPGSCSGTFTLTGGTGRLAGITGQSDMIVRTALSGTAMNESTGGTVSAAKGLAIWPEMRFEFPGKSAKAGMLGTGSIANGNDVVPESASEIETDGGGAEGAANIEADVVAEPTPADAGRSEP